MPNFLRNFVFWLGAGLITSAPLMVAEETGSAWYPKTRTGPRGSITLFAPQIEAWDQFTTVTAWTAFQIKATESDRSPYGSVKFTARTEVDLTNREVLLYDVSIIDLSIPGIETYELEYTLVQDALESGTKNVPLDLILEYLPDDMPVASTGGLNPEPPPIFFATAPAILLTVDDQPIFLPAGDSGLEFALNANWNLFRDSTGGACYLLSDGQWLVATSPEGPWEWATELPQAFASLPPDGNWDGVQESLPANLESIAPSSTPLPQVFYTTVPGELLQFDGTPQWEPMADTLIESASNTTAECYRLGDGLFLLLSGRWFSATSLEGPWTLASPLPDAFKSIPEDHAKAYLLASIPGTRPALEAALEATIPQTAEIDRTAATTLAPDVSYSGEPVFQPIAGTDITMAINTSYQVLKFKLSYYLCYNAVWFRSSFPIGPWVLADMVPAEFASIPPSSPAHNTTYVTVTESDDDTVAYSSTAGYTNSYVDDDGAVVNGTGFVQSAVAIWALYEIADNNDGWYPYPYYPWPPSYGYGSWYDPGSGRYGQTVVGYGPYGAGRSTAVYNPRTGTYGRGQSVWDNDEWAGRSYAYNPNTNTSSSRRGYYDFDDDEGWSQNVKRRGDEWIARETEWDDGQSRSDLETSRGGDGTVYRDRDGNETTGTGEFTTGNGRELESEFSRERNGDEINTERTIEGENRSATLSGTIEDGQGSFELSGSEGGSGTFNREMENGEISGSGSFTKDGKTINSESSRTAEGVTRKFESDQGGEAVTARQGDSRGFAAKSESGDVYAGRDGEVYEKTEGGWEKVEPTRNTQQSERASTRDSSGRMSTTTSNPSRSFDTRQLDRDSYSRERGTQRYQSFQRSRTSGGAGSFRRRSR